MSRELKFRGWDEELQVMELAPYICCLGGDGYEIEFADENGDYYPCPDAILEQYTGLKDKNGVEIYEGDVYTIGDADRYLVFFKSGAFCARPITNKEDHCGECEPLGWGDKQRDYSQWVAEEGEVIGNIHQSPELLEQKQ